MSAQTTHPTVRIVPVQFFLTGSLHHGNIDGRPFATDVSVVLMDCRFDSERIPDLAPESGARLLAAAYLDVELVEITISPDRLFRFANDQYVSARYAHLIEDLWMRRGQWAFSDALDTFCYRVDGEPVAFVAPYVIDRDDDLHSEAAR